MDAGQQPEPQEINAVEQPENQQINIPEQEQIEREVIPPLIGEVTDLTGIQKAGLRILLGIGGSIIVITLVIFLVSFSFSKLSSPILRSRDAKFLKCSNGEEECTDSDKVEKILTIDEYTKEINEYERILKINTSIKKSQDERFSSIFQLVIINAFLPSFTAVLGYIFGTSDKQN